MRWEIGGSDQPTRISLCDNGMQLFWGTIGQPATYKAGPAHGDLLNCVEHEIDGRITEVNFNKVGGDNDYLYSGIEIQTATKTIT